MLLIFLELCVCECGLIVLLHPYCRMIGQSFETHCTKLIVPNRTEVLAVEFMCWTAATVFYQDMFRLFKHHIASTVHLQKITTSNYFRGFWGKQSLKGVKWTTLDVLGLLPRRLISICSARCYMLFCGKLCHGPKAMCYRPLGVPGPEFKNRSFRESTDLYSR